MAYSRVTREERNHIYRWRQEGLGVRAIAARLWRSASSISRELARNMGKRGYRPKQAHLLAQERALRPGPRRFTEDVRLEAEARLREGWTPELISGRARLEGRAWVCKETIYKHIYADAKLGGDLWTYLPRSRRKRRRRCPRQEGRGRGRIPNQRMIDMRPASVETRRQAGHWEGDLINGAHETGNLVTLVERTTRFTLVGWTDSKEAATVRAVIEARLALLPLTLRLSVTFDNGKEFAQHEALARSLGLDVYFAKPYHSWERGTNENTNGLIRRLHPKQSSFAAGRADELARIDKYLNDRPRKCLGWMTPREKMAACLVSALRQAG
jgi:IS30 family transposase